MFCRCVFIACISAGPVMLGMCVVSGCLKMGGSHIFVANKISLLLARSPVPTVMTNYLWVQCDLTHLVIPLVLQLITQGGAEAFNVHKLKWVFRSLPGRLRCPTISSTTFSTILTLAFVIS